MHIHLITTGGTIDKTYAPQAGTMNFSFGDPLVLEFLQSINPSFSFEISEICRKDSLDMTDTDRQAILAACQSSESNFILITHGTDTMVETAQVLQNIKNKTLVLFGASRPGIFKNTDAEINFGVALGAVQALPFGVYVAMNGQIHKAGNCRKNAETGQFEATT